MAEEAAKKGKPEKGKKKVGKYSRYTISGDKLERKNKSCPKCGSGVFMAKHKDRYSCGTCSYTEWGQK